MLLKKGILQIKINFSKIGKLFSKNVVIIDFVVDKLMIKRFYFFQHPYLCRSYGASLSLGLA